MLQILRQIAAELMDHPQLYPYADGSGVLVDESWLRKERKLRYRRRIHLQVRVNGMAQGRGQGEGVNP